MTLDSYLTAAFGGAAYAPTSSSPPDLDYIPWSCVEAVARALCPPEARQAANAPRYGTFTAVPNVMFLCAFNRWADAVGQLHSRFCLGDKAEHRRDFALLGIELPTLRTWYRLAHAPAPDGFPFVAPDLKFTVPYASAGYYSELDGACTLRPAAPVPGAPRRYLAVFMGTNINGAWWRELVITECSKAADCAVHGLANHNRSAATRLASGASSEDSVYDAATFCLQPWGDTATRRAYWDALAHGCINVIFADRQGNHSAPARVYADELFGDHEQYTVTVPEAD